MCLNRKISIYKGRDFHSEHSKVEHPSGNVYNKRTLKIGGIHLEVQENIASLKQHKDRSYTSTSPQCSHCLSEQFSFHEQASPWELGRWKVSAFKLDLCVSPPRATTKKLMRLK